MPDFARVIGGAGTGKTSHLLELMEKVIAAGHLSPYQIGFVSFTRAAREEAAQRAGKKFNVSGSDLVRNGWFRTLHSICYQQTGASGNLITNCKKDADWLENALQSKINDYSKTDETVYAEDQTDAEKVLNIWSCSCNMLQPFQKVWQRALYCDERVPAFEYCKTIIERYEQHKRLDGRVDFNDIMARYAGIRFKLEGVEKTNPVGEIPDVPVWFLDECQDNSALTDSVARRLVSSARWVYLVGDPFQAIYGWSGASAKHFLSWDVPKDKQRVLQQTFRCPAPIVDLGEKIISNCSDYFDRGIQPAEHEGQIDRINFYDTWEDRIKVNSEKWLLVARSRFQARRIGKRLDDAGIPWRTTGEKDNNKWNAPIRNSVLYSMATLEIDESTRIKLSAWREIVKFLPVRDNFKRGTKKRMLDLEEDDRVELTIDELCEYGCTEEFKAKIRNQGWRDEVSFAPEYVRALYKHGQDAIYKPQIRVGTIHSVKGAEEDNVMILSATSHQIARGQEDLEGSNEERRVEYVGVTRARKRLVVASDSYSKYSMDLA